MMNLIGCEVCGTEWNPAFYAALSEEEKTELYRLSKKHDLAHLVGNALVNHKLLDEGKLKEAYQKETFLAVYRCERLAYELKELRRAFNEAQIPFIPLKGSVIRAYYPEPWMRTSCDIDILVKESDADAAADYLAKKLSYRFEVKGQHDISLFAPSGIHIELHFKLMDLDFQQVPMLNDVWTGGEIAIASGCEYRMSNELFLLYHIYHMAKHFIHGGCGIKPFIDLWIIKNRIGYQDEKAESLLRESNLLLFYNRATELGNVWFEENAHNAVTREMENYVLSGGVYGSLEQYLAMTQNRKGGAFGFLLSKLFLSYEQMKIYYPSLKKCPLLFPFYQVRRWFRILFCGGRKSALDQIRVNQTLSDEKKRSSKNLMDELGL